MSDPTPPPADDEVDMDEDVTLETVIRAFLRTFPTPTDQQLHFFSESLGIPYESFEEQVFQMFGKELEAQDFEELMDDDGEFAEDDLDLFLIAFFAFMPSPSEEVVHKIAQLIDVTPEELEQRIYRMLGELIGPEDDELVDDDEDDDDEDSEESDDSEDDSDGEDVEEDVEADTENLDAEDDSDDEDVDAGDDEDSEDDSDDGK